MPNLAFIRSAMCIECWDYYEMKTDIWVFGDVEGYSSFRQELLKATDAAQNIHLDLLNQHPTSMRAVILPAKKNGVRKPQLKLIERFICDKNGPNMELVIFGNQLGYQYLAEKLARLIRENVGVPSEHIHLDDLTDAKVIPRSVSLNLRGPIRQWGREGLADYADFVYSKGEAFLPSALDRQLDRQGEYEEIEAEKSEFLRLEQGRSIEMM